MGNPAVRLNFINTDLITDIIVPAEAIWKFYLAFVRPAAGGFADSCLFRF